MVACGVGVMHTVTKVVHLQLGFLGLSPLLVVVA